MAPQTATEGQTTADLLTAARLYAFAREAEPADLDRALELLEDVDRTLTGYVGGGVAAEGTAAELRARARRAARELQRRHEAALTLVNQVRRELADHRPNKALATLQTLPSCQSDPRREIGQGEPCLPFNDAHINTLALTGAIAIERNRARDLLDRGDALAVECRDPRGAARAYRAARTYDMDLDIEMRLSAADQCLPDRSAAIWAIVAIGVVVWLLHITERLGGARQ
jgi:hypothetical protein